MVSNTVALGSMSVGVGVTYGLGRIVGSGADPVDIIEVLSSL